MNSSIGVLPQEIQAFILSKLDGKSAANAKKVSRLWNEIITGLETSLHFWLRCCLKELPPYILVELTRLLQVSAGRKSTLVELSNDWNNSLESKLPWMFWLEVYAEYCSICCHDETDVCAENQQMFTLQDTCAALEQLHPSNSDIVITATSSYLQDNEVEADPTHKNIIKYGENHRRTAGQLGDRPTESFHPNQDLVPKWSSYICSGEMNKTEFHFFPLEGEVSCLHEHDGVIYSGHKSGAVMTWSYMDMELTYDILYRHHRTVTCITGIDMVKTTADILNGDQHHRIVSCSRDATLMVFNTGTEKVSTLKHYTHQVNCVRCWGSLFVAAANRSMIQGQPVWKYDSQSESSISIECSLFSQSASNITAVAFWEDSVLSGDELGNVFLWSRCWCNPASSRGNPQREMTHLVNLHSPIKALFLLSSRIVCFTGDHKLHICKNKNDPTFHSHDIYAALLVSPECVAVRGAILAIGCRSGPVFLYHVPLDSDWDCIDLSKPGCTVHTGHEHVNDIVIGDDGGGPFIVMATEGHVITRVQFRRKHDVKVTEDKT